ncbi:MAG: carbamoyltransferase HypF [Desulfovibrionaceae bacterium]|nr:carbamoyltransferase HypF [Desulfovibrionaceae bacterium]
MRTLRLQVFGIVQGVGFRPYVHRLAIKHNMMGTVANKGSLVEIFIQTKAADPVVAEENFIKALIKEAPPRSLIMKIKTSLEHLPELFSFTIIESEEEPGDIFVSPDIAICETCQQELFDPKNRRYLHPFINCTACGPRLTILDAMPYDRERTSMKGFPMCDECSREYYSPKTRRYDAQPVCCNECGPKVRLVNHDLEGTAAISYVRQAILEDKIIAIKGIGGFHLCCNAYSKEAIEKLRSRKIRPTKPFAVMFRDIIALKRACVCKSFEEEILTGWQKPIVLLTKREEQKLADNLAPDNPSLGAMLPYTPLHLLLFSLPDGLDMVDCLVMTSANITDAPICRTTHDACLELKDIAEHILTHNRHINLRADDSVLEVREEKIAMIRRSRGYAPLPIILDGQWGDACLGIGAELKNTFCLAQNGLFYLSPHIGDLGDLRTNEALSQSLKRLEELLRIKPTKVACDCHPNYHSHLLAEELELPVVYVQHHYAHILSCMAENNYLEPVLGLALDGTGYGLDGTIWGGEILKADLNGFERLASIEPFPHTGADLAAKEGWRIAVSMLGEIFPEDQALNIVQDLELCEAKLAKIQLTLTARKINTVTSTSSGRLFDAVSAILGFKKSASFEGEAACLLQFQAEKAYANLGDLWPAALDLLATTLGHDALSGLPLKEDRTIATIPVYSLIERLVWAKKKGISPKLLALAFHVYLANSLSQICAKFKDKYKLNTCALSGGVFQNRLLQRFVKQALEDLGFQVLTHSLIPPNDGGLSLGQALACARNN